MWSINRSILVVRPRQPYLDWVHSLDEGGKKFTLQDLRHDGTSYLVPQLEDEDQQDEILADIYEEVFEHELWAMATERANVSDTSKSSRAAVDEDCPQRSWASLLVVPLLTLFRVRFAKKQFDQGSATALGRQVFLRVRRLRKKQPGSFLRPGCCVEKAIDSRDALSHRTRIGKRITPIAGDKAAAAKVLEREIRTSEGEATGLTSQQQSVLRDMLDRILSAKCTP
ncbi:MAG: hypothetical protein IT427_15955 [Pirellulales bacterium]|jgi:hypothetical protein|nr:hypothetical protein [Pirellulales bacterium]